MRTDKAGFKISTVMLMFLSVVMADGCSILDKAENRWHFDREEVAGLIVEKDAGDLYELMSPYMLEETSLTEDDLQEFLDKCDIGNTSSKDKDNVGIYYIEYLEKDPETGNYRTIEEFGERED